MIHPYKRNALLELNERIKSRRYIPKRKRTSRMTFWMLRFLMQDWFAFPEHNRKGYGWIGYEDALRVSSNTFFYQVGVGVGIKALYKAATKLGFDALTGIEIGYEESKGLVGNKEWADKGRGWGKPGTTPWIPEDMASASIGQAVVQITPLQLARAYAVFANGGYLITPHL